MIPSVVQYQHHAPSGSLLAQQTLEKALVAVKDGNDHDYHAIRAAIDALNEATMRLAELMMDTAVSTALKGKAMDDSDLAEGPQAGHPVAKADFE